MNGVNEVLDMKSSQIVRWNALFIRTGIYYNLLRQSINNKIKSIGFFKVDRLNHSKM